MKNTQFPSRANLICSWGPKQKVFGILNCSLHFIVKFGTSSLSLQQDKLCLNYSDLEEAKISSNSLTFQFKFLWNCCGNGIWGSHSVWQTGLRSVMEFFPECTSVSVHEQHFKFLHRIYFTPFLLHRMLSSYSNFSFKCKTFMGMPFILVLWSHSAVLERGSLCDSGDNW